MLNRTKATLRRLFDARYGALVREVRGLRAELQGASPTANSFADAVSVRVAKRVEESLERQHQEVLGVAALLGRGMEQTADAVSELLERPGGKDGQAENAQPRRQPSWTEPEQLDLSSHTALGTLDQAHADVANYAYSHLGWASQAGLWFNPPISIQHEPGAVTVADINERVAEIPFVFASLGDLPRGSRVLDIGSCESTVAIALASLGHHVTALDPRPYPLRHANLTVVVAPVEEYRPDHQFDAAVMLSAIEHFGLGSYDLPVNDDADREAIQAVWNALRPGGALVLTTPYGDAPTTELERTYRPEQIARLFDRGWEIVDRTYLTKTSRTEWHQVDEVTELKGDHVVLIKAVKVST